MTDRKLLRELVEDVIGDRADAVYVRPVLTVMLRTAINDFSRYYAARHATNRIADTDILLARNRAAKAKVRGATV